MKRHNRGLVVQFSVLRALLVRDAMMRFGHENLGFFWIILEPLMFATGVAFVWSLTGHGHGPGVSTIAFALTGYISVTLFRHIVGSSLHIFRANLALRYHRNIKILDIYLARGVLEVLGCLAAFYVAYVPLSVLGVIDPMRDPLLAMGGFWLHAWFCLSFGLIIASLAVLSEVLEKILPVTTYLTLPLTGIFTMQSWLPQTARKVLSWSPMVNAVEMFRNGMFSADVTAYWSAWYVIGFCFAQTVIAIVLLDYVKDRVDLQS